MNNDIQAMGKQNQEVESSEQYAINIIGNRTLQSADFVLKESKRTVEKALAGKSAPQQAPTAKLHRRIGEHIRLQKRLLDKRLRITNPGFVREKAHIR